MNCLLASRRPVRSRRSAARPLGYRAIWVASLLLALAAAGPSVPRAGAADAPEGTRRAVIIRMEGTITPLVERFIHRALDQAQRREVDVVIIEIDSPGGYLDASLALSERFREIAWAETVAYIPREALSGAAIAALGCDRIYLHSAARLGDAGPIFLGKDFLFRHAPEKVRSDLAQRMREIARQGGRPPTLVEAMVDMDLLVYEMRHRGSDEVAFLSELEIAALDSPDDWDRRRPIVETGEGRFLEVTGQRAVELGLADGVVTSQQGLLAELRLASSPEVIRSTAVDSLVFWLNHPLVTGLVLVIGLVALYLEMAAPGISIGGLISGLCFSLFFWSRFLGGTAGWLEVILFLAGLVFLAFEILVLPGFGVCGLTGIVLLGASLILASQDFVVPSTPRQWERLAVSSMVLIGSFFLFVAAAVFITRNLGRLPMLNRLTLNSPPGDSSVSEAGGKGAFAPFSVPLVGLGDVGIADSPLRPAGKAMFADEYVDVVADGTFVDAGSKVRVIKVEGNRVVVRAIDEPTV